MSARRQTETGVLCAALDHLNMQDVFPLFFYSHFDGERLANRENEKK